MRRLRSSAFFSALFFAAVCLSLVLAGCTAPVRPPTSRATAAREPLHFGPVYPVGRVTDPLIAKTLRLARKRKSPAVSAEIRGYLVDWTMPTGNGRAIREVAVMKDGSLYRLMPFERPASAFGAKPRRRLGPEPGTESRARVAALKAAHTEVARNSEFASVKPVVYNYLVRIHYADGKQVDVWVDPDVYPGRLFYKVELTRMTEFGPPKNPPRAHPVPQKGTQK